MAAAPDLSYRPWKKRESFGSAMTQIGITAVLLTGIVYAIYARAEKKRQIAERMKEARAVAVRDNAKDYQKALGLVDEVLAMDSSAPDALALGAELHTQLWLVHRVPGEEARAKDFLQRAEKAEAKSEDRYASFALQTLSGGKSKEADDYVEGLREKGASSAKLWYALAQSKQALGQLSLAREAYKQAADKAWKNPRFSAAYTQALIDEQNFVFALDVADKGVASNPEHVQARLVKGLLGLYRKDGVVAKFAADTVREVLAEEQTPGMKALALATGAEVALYAGSPDEALRMAGEALAANPEEYRALFARARALAAKKDPAAAQAFKDAVARKPTAPLLYLDGAAQLQQAGDMTAALGLLDAYEGTFKDIKLTSLDGSTSSALERDDRYYLVRGDVLRAAGKPDEALAAYEKAIAAKSVLQGRAYYAKGDLLLSQKQYDKAKEALAVVAIDDGSGTIPDAYMAMGHLLFEQKEFAVACTYYGFALAKFRGLQEPREKLNGIVTDVEKKLVAAKQKDISKAWAEEAKGLLQ
ncbi:MAG: hypothetical protein RL653_954 [Pseudomonadota bacterium]|jgi:tetratricopeptide (TPR) repeat protein